MKLPARLTKIIYNTQRQKTRKAIPIIVLGLDQYRDIEYQWLQFNSSLKIKTRLKYRCLYLNSKACRINFTRVRHCGLLVRDQTKTTPSTNIHGLIRGENYANEHKYGTRPVGVIDSRASRRHFYHFIYSSQTLPRSIFTFSRRHSPKIEPDIQVDVIAYALFPTRQIWCCSQHKICKWYNFLFLKSSVVFAIKYETEVGARFKMSIIYFISLQISSPKIHNFLALLKNIKIPLAIRLK